MSVLLLIARIILLILFGMSAPAATARVSRESGVSFETLWASLPDQWKG